MYIYIFDMGSIWRREFTLYPTINMRDTEIYYVIKNEIVWVLGWHIILIWLCAIR